MTRGDVFRLPAPRGARGVEQRGPRYAVVVQADEFAALSTVVVAPTSTSVRPASFRPVVEVGGTSTRVLVEQLRAIDPQRLGRPAGRLTWTELDAVDRALRVILAL
ncbi:MAG: type II toxin-antitoxin system PemK/MazF family toxin [Gaiellaceae bacterium]